MVPGSNPGWCKLLREGTIRKGGRSESGKPKLAPLASHTKSISCTKNKGNVSISFLFYIGLTLTFYSNGFGFKPCMVQITRGGNRLEGERSKRETEVGYYTANVLSVESTDECLPANQIRTQLAVILTD